MRTPRDVLKAQRSQSAMEMLVTYSWSLLILAVVLASLFELGVFRAYSGPVVCLGNPGFLCSNVSMGTSGAVTVNLGYQGPTPITVTGLGCNVIMPYKGPSVESSSITLSPGTIRQLVFQCPVSHQALGSSVSVYLWLFYNTSTRSGLVQPYARGSMRVDYISLPWNVTVWSPNSNAVDLLPLGSVNANPEMPANTNVIAKTVWTSIKEDDEEGWSYSTDYHVSDIYNGIETALFPVIPMSLDTVPCSAPYNSLGYSAFTDVHLSGTYTFATWTDDGTAMFYRPAGSGPWNSIYLTANAWSNQPPRYYSNSVTFAPGNYEIAVDYIDTCDPAGLSTFIISPSPLPA